MSQQTQKSEQRHKLAGAIEEGQSQQPATYLPSMRSTDAAQNMGFARNAVFSQLNQVGYTQMKNLDDFSQAGKDAIDALVKSSAALTEACREISQHLLAHAHKSTTTGLVSSKEMFDIKSPTDWLDFQSKWTADFMTAAFAHMAQLSNLSARAVAETYQPLKAHFDGTFSKMDDTL